MSKDDEETIALLAASELLLADVQRQRNTLDRKERELRESIAMYRARLGTKSDRVIEVTQALPPRPIPNPADDDSDKYGAITESIVQIMKDAGRKMSAPQVANALQGHNVSIRAKSYDSAARTALRRLFETGKIRRVGPGFYRLDKSLSEAQEH
jgi:hypothetical protein